jgi:CDP-paratose synthetase
MEKKILLTGGGGFMGRALTRALINQGCTVCWLSKKASENSKVGFIDSKSKFEDEILKFNPGITIHLAAAYDNDNVTDIIECNVELPVRILKTLAGLKRENRCFLYAGSYWQNGDNSKPDIPIDIYSSSKKSLHSFIDFFAEYELISCIELIFHGSYGGDDRREKLLDKLLESARSGGEIKLSKGQQVINLVHIDDICSAIIRAVDLFSKADELNDHYTIASSKSYSIRELVSIINTISGMKVHAKWGALSYRKVEVFNPVIDRPLLPGWQEMNTIDDYIRNELIELSK